MRNPETREVKSHFAVGRIHYPTESGQVGDVPSEQSTGILVYIKPGRLEGELPPDIINYSRQIGPAFPHDPTSDQQFDSPQFESYRKLGFLAGRAVITATGNKVGVPAKFEELHVQFRKLLRDQFGETSPAAGQPTKVLVRTMPKE